MSEMEPRGVVLLTAWEDIGEEFWPSPIDQREHINVCGWVWTVIYTEHSSEMILADFPGYKQGEEIADHWLQLCNDLYVNSRRKMILKIVFSRRRLHINRGSIL
ncbi:hypothetical protein [Aeromonas eucrenophila]|uniref:Uncharacterized protein n=1 Tax=Aeromonas eucrenophila TaxID=649 RepID=A0ABW0YIV4_9GAMM|nr:hypothetical protein [Aeromonas eucrenophila]